MCFGLFGDWFALMWCFVSGCYVRLAVVWFDVLCIATWVACFVVFDWCVWIVGDWCLA